MVDSTYSARWAQG